MGAISEFFIRPSEGEYIETSVHIESEPRSAVLGTVLDSANKPVRNALVVLGCSGEKEVIAGQFTGEDGRFCFGPLDSGILYKINVFKSDIKFRELEIKAE